MEIIDLIGVIHFDYLRILSEVVYKKVSPPRGGLKGVCHEIFRVLFWHAHTKVALHCTAACSRPLLDNVKHGLIIGGSGGGPIAFRPSERTTVSVVGPEIRQLDVLHAQIDTALTPMSGIFTLKHDH
jgi:hypothetical protein